MKKTQTRQEKWQSSVKMSQTSEKRHKLVTKHDKLA